jgi:hypothetical protein
MIEILIIIILFLSLIIINMIKMIEEIRIIMELIIVSTLFFYLCFNIEIELLSRIFGILGIIFLLLIPIHTILKYVEKLK